MGRLARAARTIALLEKHLEHLVVRFLNDLEVWIRNFNSNWSQADLDRLEGAMARGELIVKLADGTQRTYRSAEELDEIVFEHLQLGPRRFTRSPEELEQILEDLDDDLVQ